MAHPVKFFTNTQQGAPQLTNDWGALTTMLDACLVNGFNLKSVTNITRDGNVATVNISTGHQYQVNQVLLMDGATQPEYNGEVRVLSVTSNSYTYAVTGTPATPATGTITAKAAPLGFEIAFTGANKRAYRSKNPMSNRPYLRVDDSQHPLYNAAYAKKGKVTMAEGMSDIDTFVGARAPYDPAAPTKNEATTGSGTGVVDGWYKWYYAKAPNSPDTNPPATKNRQWTIVGDDRGFYLFNESMDNGGIGGKCFTDFESYRSADGFNTLLGAQDVYSAASTTASGAQGDGYNSSDWGSRFIRSQDELGKVLMRSYLQIGENVRASFTSLNTNNGVTVSGLSTGISWPNGPDFSLILHPVLLKEGAHLRGKIPGLFWVHNDSPNFNHLDTITGVTGYPGRTFLILKVVHGANNLNYYGTLAFDITGPWW